MGEDFSRRIVRVARADDAAAVQAIYAPIVRDTAISFEDEPPAVAEMASRIAGTLATHPFLVCEEHGDVIGYAYAGPRSARAAYRWSADTTVYVDASTRRKGVGAALYTVLLEILTRQRFHSIFAGIALPNDRSVGLHEAMGFRSLGVYREVGFKHGAWHDVGWWRLGLAEGAPAGEPIPFAELSPDIDALIGQARRRTRADS